MSSTPSQAFWVCHECGAQMRPIMVDGVAHCASCNGEFIEILDSNVNPDPYHELPMPPPTRPVGDETPPGHQDQPWEGQAEGGFMSSLFSNLFGAAATDPGGGGGPSTSSPPTPQRQVSNPDRNGGGSGNGGRSFSFNLPGGGRGQVMFGSFGGGPPFGGRNNNPFGDQGDLGSFFPGFGPPPRNGRGGPGGQFRPLGQDDAMTPDELMRSLFAALQSDEFAPRMYGPAGNADLGDYVLSQQGFDQVLEQLMRAAGPQGPLPASDIVIEGLPKFKLTRETLEASQFKDCPVCKDDFEVGDEVKRIPCKHIFHPDCVDPWLKVNGSCPVCRFSLVPDEGNGPPQSGAPANAPSANNNQGGSYMTNVLRRLWGPTGTESGPTSPATETHPPQPPIRPESPPGPRLYPPDGVPPSSPPSSPPPAAQPQSGLQGSSEEVNRIPTSIPDDYRERHRRREQEARDLPPDEDLD